MVTEAIVVPVIDLTNFPAELEKLAVAATDLGCFRIVNHGIPPTLMAEMKAIVASLFDIPAEAKLRNFVDLIHEGGYVSPARLSRLFESFGIYDATSPADVHSFCSALDASPKQHEIIIDYVSRLHAVAMNIASRVAESLGLAGRSFNEWACHVRLNSCNFKEQEDIGYISIPAHTDFNFLTVLQEDECANGFEIMDVNGNFVAIDPVPGTFLVNIGDLGKVWSNGRMHNVTHRVVCKEAMPRFSMALLILAPKSGEIEPDTSFIDGKHPKMYKAVNYKEHRKLRITSGLMAAEFLSRLKIDHQEIVTSDLI
ncbi:hypothetical protein IEQ34_004982 [Dendrobium chrysotoxum]|uniref:Fe2OG dioxygenase domain-containing protein n=1 Tax=Dendrobium chrysotoxum TaxID=161865 RepID=A0AAV7GTT4_DENCH|nr:hypothetical protein IEQ34_004982 [Dendrobium chrysotoxum]